MAELTKAEVLLLKVEAALRVAVRALGPLTASSREACVALDTIERILSDDSPAAIVVAWCKGCEHGTPSAPCARCGGPACAACRRCPPCDGPVNTKENHD